MSALNPREEKIVGELFKSVPAFSLFQFDSALKKASTNVDLLMISNERSVIKDFLLREGFILLDDDRNGISHYLLTDRGRRLKECGGSLTDYYSNLAAEQSDKVLRTRMELAQLKFNRWIAIATIATAAGAVVQIVDIICEWFK